MGYRDRVDAPGPKKLLALDGGGVRGVITLEVLGAIEELLRRELQGGDDFVLADYFDYVAGTSTGAVIAAGIARGMTVDSLRTLYATRAREMFDRAFVVTRYWRNKYDSDRLQALLQEVLGEDTLFGDETLRTLLMMVLRNATTDSPWPLSNNPRAKYSAEDRPDNNLKLPLWQLVRASTAAPTFFPPEQIDLPGRSFVFVDGGVTMYNNPAFQLFLMATMDAYRLRWETGEDRMLVVSVGTGHAPKAADRLNPGEMNLLYNASSVPAALMAAALHEQDLLCRTFGRCRHGAPIDREVGDLIARPGAPDGGLMPERLFSYLRYNAELTRAGLDRLGLPDVRPEDVQRLDSVAHIGDLQRVGMRAAREVLPEHFAGFLPVAS
jgi:patatin-like phospholipase/acyl hydrolase